MVFERLNNWAGLKEENYIFVYRAPAGDPVDTGLVASWHGQVRM